MNGAETTWNNIATIFSQIAFYISFVPVVIGTLKRKLFSKSLHIFYGYLLIDLLIAASIQLFLWSIKQYPDVMIPLLEQWKISDTNFFNIFYKVNTVAMLGWYFSTIIPNISVARLIKWGSRLLVVLMIINCLFIEGFRVAGFFSPTVATICGFVFPAIHLWYLFREDQVLILTRNPYFWIALGLVVSNVLRFFFTLTGQQLFDADFVLFSQLNVFTDVLVGIGYLFFGLGFFYAHNVEFLHEE